MSRYQLGEQIWSIELVGAKITIVEPDGTRSVEELVNGELARTRLRVLTNQKLRAGWKVTREAPAPAELPPPATIENARNPELEAALLADPAHVPSWLVYGDWLQQQGDPRGTHIALRAAVISAPDDLLAVGRLRQYEVRYGRYLRGGFEGVLGWGFLDDVRIGKLAEVEVVATPAGRFITKLGIEHSTTSQASEIVASLGRLAPVTLRELSATGPGHAVIPSLEPLEPILSRIRVLDLHTSIPKLCLAHLARTPMPHLTQLGLRNAEYGTEEALVALLGRGDLPELTVLHLDEQRRVPNIYQVLAASPIARQLESLALVSVEESDVVLLASLLDSFPKLAYLELPIDVLDLPRGLLSELEARVGRVVGLSSRYAQISE
ncbi:MAG: TIGR02996 domain-containing protein [Deltaproteobacteria bacterium]|nr:TIGR02996 domain-containing protein [Deltaproteobacteria bacterium]